MSLEPPYRIVLADDHEVFRLLLMRLLNERSDLEIAGEAGDGGELLTLLNRTETAAHMAIVDITMPNIGGIAATEVIKRAHPGVKVLMLSVHRENQYVQGAFSAGANGYLLKEVAMDELFRAIDIIRGGGVYLSPLLMNETHRTR